MKLDYNNTQASLQEELRRLALVRERVAGRLARVDRQIEAVSVAAEALAKASEPEPSQNSPPPAVEEAVEEKEADFEITANVREIIASAKHLSAPAIRDALVLRGWKLEDYKNPMAVVHQILKRLRKNGDVDVFEYLDARGRTMYYDKRSADERQAKRDEELAAKRATREATEAARAEVRRTIAEPCREILLTNPRGISALGVYRQLEKAGFDLSCYKAQTYGVAAVLKGIPGARVFTAERNGAVQSFWHIRKPESAVAKS